MKDDNARLIKSIWAGCTRMPNKCAPIVEQRTNSCQPRLYMKFFATVVKHNGTHSSDNRGLKQLNLENDSRNSIKSAYQYTTVL